jgi:HD-GYP domain-containing protein (c-di-GMP phosphodiesterase class II)
VLRHHERVDGKGYPSRMAGDQIPLASRVIQIADAWVAMTSQQSYAPAMSPTETTSRMREESGKQFDAALLEKFLANLSEIVDEA